MSKKMMYKKDWEEFRKTGLLLFINQILHVFGWCIVCSVEDNKITSVYPARTRFRGFDEESVTESYINVTKYLKNNIDNLVKEVNEDDE